VAAASLSNLFFNFNTTTSSPTPFLLSQESTRSPSHRIILALLRIMLASEQGTRQAVFQFVTPPVVTHR
jgi:hypothetical protein